MSVSPADPTSRVVLLLIQLSAAVHDAFGVTPVKVAFRTLEAGRDFSLPVPLLPAIPSLPAALAVAPVVVLSDADQTILQAISEMKGRPVAADIAEKSGYPYDSHLKMRLSILRQRGMLGGAKGDTGYPVTDAAYEAMAAALIKIPVEE